MIQLYFMYVLIIPFTKGESQIDQLQKYFLGKSNERTMAQKLQFWLRRGPKLSSGFLGLHNSLLMCLGQDQQQDPAVHTGGVSRERVHGCGCLH